MSPSTVRRCMGMMARRGVGRGIHAPALKMTRWMRVTLHAFCAQFLVTIDQNTEGR